MKQVFLVSLLLSLLYPLFYLIFSLYVPQGYEFSGLIEGDDGTNLTLMKSVNNNLQNPWAVAEPRNVFLNPNMGSAFLYIPLGFIAKLLNDNFFLIFQISRIIGSFVFLISVYLFLREFFDKLRSKRIFLLFCLSFGLGGLLFLVSNPTGLVPGPPFVGFWNPLSYEMFEGTGITPLTILSRQYYTIPLALGFFSLICLKRKRLLLGGVLLALADLIYPSLGIAFYFISAIQVLIFGNIRESWKSYLSYYAISALGSLPWLYFYHIDSTMFRFYNDLRIAASPLAIMVSVFPHLIFIAILMWKLIQNRRLFYLLLLLPATFLLLGTSFLTIPKYAFVAVISGVYIYLLREKKDMQFFWFWLLYALIFSVIPPQKTIFFSARFMLVLWLPLVVLSYFGIEEFAAYIKNRISVKAITFSLILITLTSAFFFMTYFIRKTLPINGWPLYPDYIYSDEYSAYKFLSQQPRGVVLSSEEIGTNLPYITNQISLLGRSPVVRDFTLKHKDYLLFFDEKEPAKVKKNIVDKYGISYVYFGEIEKIPSNFKLSLDGIDFLQPIYSSKHVTIYKVI